MHEAICTLDNVTYHIDRFAGLPEQEIKRLRYSLECKKCRQPAYFSKASTGKQPWFASLYHLDCCKERPTEPNQVELSYTSTAKVVPHGTRKIVVSTDKRTGQVASDDAADAQTGRADNIVKRSLSFKGAGKEWKCGVHALLAALMDDNALKQSNIIIDVSGGGTALPAHEFFHDGFNLTEQVVGQVRGFWGPVVAANQSPDRGGVTLWMHIGDHGNQSLVFKVASNLYEEAYEKFSFTRASELVGAYVLGIGTVKKSRNGYCMDVSDLDLIAVRRT